MTYAAWEPRHRVTTIRPGKLDLFVITLIDGVRASIDTIMEYDLVLARAEALHRDHDRCQIKVLPVTGPEVRNLLGIKFPDNPEPIDPEVRQQLVSTLLHIAREGSDADARSDAFDLLEDMGVFRP